MAKPFLKWAGGKRQLLPELRQHVPDSFGRYFEPFVGGGALFFWLQARGYITDARLNDLNTRLMQVYRAVQGSPQMLVERLYDFADDFKQAKVAGNDRAFYELVRATPPREDDINAVAAWLMFLNRTCFNGLYRVNKQGRFNTPYGKYKAPVICDAAAIWEASRALRGVDLRSGDFRFAVTQAKRGDLVYFDPPYPPVSDTADFTAYTAAGFGPEQHRALRDTALALKKRGVHVIVSMAALPFTTDLYTRGFTIREVAARRNINSKGAKRGGASELIIT